MKKSIKVLMLAIIACIFFQCADDDAQGCICPEIYAPVCGDDGILYGNSCEADCAGVNYTDGFCPEETNALILDLGDPAADGCGWVLEIVTQGDLIGYYHPDTLSEQFKVDSLMVNVDYRQTLESFQCGLSFSNEIPVIEILEIEEP